MTTKTLTIERGPTLFVKAPTLISAPTTIYRHRLKRGSTQIGNISKAIVAI